MKLFVCIFVILVVFSTKIQGNELYYNTLQKKDHIGRIVKLNRNICRVISLAPSITEIIFSLEAQNKLIGVTKHSDYPVEAKLLPTVGSYIQPNLEKIIALKPDLCLAIKDGNPSHIVTRLESLGIPVYVVDPRSFDSILFTVTDIGFLLDIQSKAYILVQQLTKRINNIKNVTSKSQNTPSVFFQLEISPIISVGDDTFINDMISLVNAKNIIKGIGPYPQLSCEDILRLKPDIIIITAVSSAKVLFKEKSKWETWLSLLDLPYFNIFIENTNLFNRPSIRLIDGLELFAKLVHPKLF